MIFCPRHAAATCPTVHATLEDPQIAVVALQMAEGTVVKEGWETWLGSNLV